MKSTTFVLASLLASVAIAQPHRHQHREKHNKRNAEVVWVTDWDYVTETVGVTTTVWVSEGFVEPTAAATTTSSLSSSTSSTSTPAPQSKAPVEFFESASKPATSSSSSVYVAPTPTSVYVAPAPVSTSVAPTTSAPPTPVYVAPVQSSTSVAPAPVAVPESTPSPAYTPPAATTSAAPVVAAASTPASSSYSGTCSSGSPCEGDITFYEAGLGACGITSDGSTEKVVALPHGLMGTQSNGNPYCGLTITIKCNGKTTTATVVDKCMGCEGNSIDVSNAAFLELDSLDVGRTTAEWYFN